MSHVLDFSEVMDVTMPHCTVLNTLFNTHSAVQ